ncbi:hypothetical protein OIDMADRAFT_158460 [Oidiodendron maius Zn]|uniref:Nucleolar 27S pre-rRNA processing Urb2/Npa2 C-terminal domain-containing protein n=1 Tax=Oidiodendron maius (strain Zn) TaxID=913774 RepID=A0A0C3HN28_OIDMZ|nr:hypothetical protein OIDMADRAFT_158460 [Oidiodendron maius Zn]
MASKSRAAQEKLAQLEKDSAPFEDQLVEAVKFVGTDVDYIGRYSAEGFVSEKQSNAGTSHGREEWLLRWLLKRLQSAKDDTPRKSPNAWRLLCHVSRAMPVVTAARILQEKKFMSILQQTLEETKEAYSTNGDIGKKSSSNSTEEGPSSTASSKASRKRKRSGELVPNTTNGDNGPGDLLEAIYSVISYVQHSAKPNLTAIDDGRGAEFSAEAMRSVMRTTAEEAAKVLGIWLALTQLVPSRRRICQLAGRSWLSYFIEIWELHSQGIEDLMQFSLYSSQALISLLRTAKSEDAPSKDWVHVLEELVARNIMIPAKAANANNPELDLIGTLTRVSVITDSANAPLLFEIAIRAIKPQGTRRRRPEDDAWLQTVFNTLVEAMLPSRCDQNSKAIRGMLQSAITYKVGFELPILRTIASRYALPGGATNWELLHTLILLDANVFLIPDTEINLLQELLTRVTTASAETSWMGLSRQIVSDVVLPLMSEAANARDLSGFIRHWHTELVEFEKLRREKSSSSIIFSAWEDDALQTHLSKLLEPSLTLRQITEILDFLEERVEKWPNEVCVILEAIAGSISREDIIDAVQLRLYHIMFDNGRPETLDARYQWRSWRILSRTLAWATNSQIEEVAVLWEEKVKPFDAFSGSSYSRGLLKWRDERTVHLESLEFLRAGCAAWEKAEEWSPLKKLAKAAMLGLLQGLSHDIKLLLQDLINSAKQLGEEKCGSNFNTQYRGVGWMVWSYTRCVFVEYPKTLDSEGRSENSHQTPSYELMPLSPDVLALKVKIMQLPTSHEGMKFDDLILLADALGNPRASVPNPRTNHAEFKKLAELTLMQMTANLDQPRSHEYALDAIKYIQKQLPSQEGKGSGEQEWNFTSVTLFQVVLFAFSTKKTALNELGILSSGDLRGIIDAFKDSLLGQLKTLLKMPKQSPNSSRKTGAYLKLFSIIDALTAFHVDGSKLAALTDDVKHFIDSLTDAEDEVASRLDTFMAVHSHDTDGEPLNVDLNGNTSTTFGRQGILDKVKALVATKDRHEKLDLLSSALGDDLTGISQLDKLLAVRHIISSCKGLSCSPCSSLNLIILRCPECRALSQWNIDSTLGSITILCSRNGASLPSIRAGNIYLRLCHLFQAVLTNHRLKLQGHFHLVVQCLQALLRCLFIPLPHTSAKFAKLYAPPPWLSPPQHQLKAVHAAAFTRLVTSICDPSVSSVTRSQRNNLTSATEEAKRIAGQHMQFVLMTYVKLQLEMKMLPEVREKMIPGLYAIFDTTTPELRKVISESLDSSGRAVFGTLYRDYVKFGKWKGS